MERFGTRAAGAAGARRMEAFIARQPIFDASQQVYGYELLFRSGLENAFPVGVDPSQATSRLISDSVLLMGLEALTGGKRAFVNVTAEVLLNDFVSFLPPDRVVVEILETIDPTPEVVAACRRLKQSGYVLALDDFAWGAGFEPLLQIADMVKIDFRAASDAERRASALRAQGWTLPALAEKVESHAEFVAGQRMGYAYFQGYFFSRPVVLTHKAVPESKLHYVEVLRHLHRPDLDLEAIEKVIKREVSLSYRLLRYVNSAVFALRSEITSIRHALVMLGHRQVRKWASFMTVAAMAEERPQELVRLALVRARFCEAQAEPARLPQRADELFLAGMFSLLDAIMDVPIDVALKEISISADVKAALLGGHNVVRAVLDLVLAYEGADWPRVTARARELGIDEATIPRAYAEAVAWVEQSLVEAQPAG